MGVARRRKPRRRLRTAPTAIPDRLLSVKQVAERLSVTTATVYGLCAAGRLPHVRILNVIRIAQSDLATFITSCRVGDPGSNAS